MVHQLLRLCLLATTCFDRRVTKIDKTTNSAAPPFESSNGAWQWIRFPDRAYRGRMVALISALVVGIGAVDYLSGFAISFLVFYLLPICLATVSLGRIGGLITAVSSVITWVVGDLAAGARYENPLVPFWNALIGFSTYLVVMWLVGTLLSSHREMEARVKQRTAALAREIIERQRLEKVVLEISERERRSIGHELHDSLGQHLTGTSVTAQVLAERLQDRAAEEAPEARKVVRLIKTGIEQTRQLAKGLLLADIDAEGLPNALREFCTNTTMQFHVECVFQGEDGIVLAENGVASHLYRIAQEAGRNAIQHGRARRIVVRLNIVEGGLVLNVADDGVGLPSRPDRGPGLGLRIMEHRAKTIGASFAIETPPGGGTVVECTLPLPG